MLVTSARSPFYFSLHASDPTDPEGGSRKDTGHTLICGPTGSGKTVFIGFLVAALSRQGATQIVFDKDRGLEILVRALGGEYCALKNGEPTGFNPLKLPPTPLNVEFLKSWLRVLVRPAQRRAHRAPASRSRSGAARNPGARAPGAAAVAPPRVPGLDRRGGTACAPVALVCADPRATTPGSSTTRRTSSSRGSQVARSWGSMSRISSITR